MSKPPLGIQPRFMWIEIRQYELSECIERYLEACWEIPEEIFTEYNLNCEELKRIVLNKEEENERKQRNE